MAEKVYTHKVVTLEGVILDKYENEGAATTRATTANAQAESLGIKARYEVKPV